VPKINIDDLQIYYQQEGEGEDIVLISGLSADHLAWEPIYAALTQRYRVLRFGNRGVGQTTTPSGPYSINRMADDVTVLLDALQIDAAHIVGHSMGGYIAQQFAVAHAAKLKKLILMTSGARPTINIQMLCQT